MQLYVIYEFEILNYCIGKYFKDELVLILLYINSSFVVTKKSNYKLDLSIFTSFKFRRLHRNIFSTLFWFKLHNYKMPINEN